MDQDKIIVLLKYQDTPFFPMISVIFAFFLLITSSNQLIIKSKIIQGFVLFTNSTLSLAPDKTKK
jgi:hypothetical protein